MSMGGGGGCVMAKPSSAIEPVETFFNIFKYWKVLKEYVHAFCKGE